MAPAAAEADFQGSPVDEEEVPEDAEGLVKLLEQRVAELEAKVRHREQQLAAERDVSTRAKKKIKQLLLKLGERDEVVAELRAALEAVHAVNAATGGDMGELDFIGHKSSGRSGRSRRARKSTSGGLTGLDLALKERAEIVSQLEGHLAQMRANLAESEREVQDLEVRRRTKEAEWKNSPDDARTVESTQVHWQALSMIGQQIQEKRRFAAELTSKTRELEEQVAQQRALLDGSPPPRRGGGGTAVVGAGHVGSWPAPPGPLLRLDSADGEGAEEMMASPSPAKSATPDECEDEALRAFLAAAGPAADAILRRPALLTAFEEQPPRLSAESIEGCSADERVQVLSLFAAWVAVAPEPPRALIMEEIELGLAEVTELAGTLETCCAQLDEWDLTRCKLNDATVKALLKSLAAQPLQRLNLGYNALGHPGAAALVGAAPSWESTLEHLALEMNGLSDGGCLAVAEALQQGLLPKLRVLELGWNELSSACAQSLACLLSPERRQAGGLRKLSLAGNRFGCEGAAHLAIAALACPRQALELDLSMNHVGAKPLAAIADWAEVCEQGLAVAVSINLEWNVVDDGEVVQRLARAVGGRCVPLDDPAVSQPMVRLGNNEIADVDAPAISLLSRGLIAC